MDHDQGHPKNPNYTSTIISAPRLREHRLAQIGTPEILDDSSDVDESDPRRREFCTPKSVPTSNRQFQEEQSKIRSSTPLNGPPRYPKGFRPPMAITLETLDLSAIKGPPSGLGMRVSGRQKFLQLSPNQEESTTGSSIKITEEDSEDSDDDIAVPIRPNPFKKTNQTYIVQVPVLSEHKSKSPTHTETEVLTLDDSEPNPVDQFPDPSESDDSSFQGSTKENRRRSESDDDEESDEEPLSPEALRRMEARTGTIPKPIYYTRRAAAPAQVQGGTKFLSLDQLPSQSREPDAGGHGTEKKKRKEEKSPTIISELLNIIESSPDPNSPLGPNDQLPKRLRADLFAHQVYGLRWLWWREGCMPGGGILADEMGLGKTVMVIALVCRGLELGSQDFGQPARRSRLVPSKATLVVVPSSVFGQWAQEIRVKANRLIVYHYYGPNRARCPKALSRNDIVLTTFKTLQLDMTKVRLSSSPLAKIYWDRVVLDEGHMIRNPLTVTALAACGLNAKHRWILTGTPVHNKPGDMYSLVKFLRLSPFDDRSAWDHWIGIKKVISKDGAQDGGGGEEDLNLSRKLKEDFITLRNPVFAENFESAKITRLLRDLKALQRIAAREGRPMDKVVILSQWNPVLNIIGSHLSRQGFTFTSITGEIKMCERTEIIACFNSNPKRPQIMLLSLKAGGVGLNLTGANIMFVMDLHWNPQNELQAHDRIHRFGQKKQVQICRYLCQDSIDERVNGIQLEKKELADELLDSAKKSQGPGLSLQDMHKLFGC